MKRITDTIKLIGNKVRAGVAALSGNTTRLSKAPIIRSGHQHDENCSHGKKAKRVKMTPKERRRARRVEMAAALAELYNQYGRDTLAYFNWREAMGHLGYVILRKRKQVDEPGYVKGDNVTKVRRAVRINCPSTDFVVASFAKGRQLGRT